MPRSPRQIIEAENRLTRFTELMDRGLDVAVICERMGIGKGAGYAMKMKIDQTRRAEHG